MILRYGIIGHFAEAALKLSVLGPRDQSRSFSAFAQKRAASGNVYRRGVPGIVGRGTNRLTPMGSLLAIVVPLARVSGIS